MKGQRNLALECLSIGPCQVVLKMTNTDRGEKRWRQKQHSRQRSEGHRSLGRGAAACEDVGREGLEKCPAEAFPMRFHSSTAGFAVGDGIEVAEEVVEGGDGARVEVEYAGGIERHAKAPGLGVNAEGRFEQVVHHLAHIDVDSGVRQREHDVASQVRLTPLAGLRQLLHQFIETLRAGPLALLLPLKTAPRPRPKSSSGEKM